MHGQQNIKFCYDILLHCYAGNVRSLYCQVVISICRRNIEAPVNVIFCRGVQRRGVLLYSKVLGSLIAQALVFRRVRKIAKSDYQLLYMSVRLSVQMERLCFRGMDFCEI